MNGVLKEHGGDPGRRPLPLRDQIALLMHHRALDLVAYHHGADEISGGHARRDAPLDASGSGENAQSDAI